MLNSLLKLKTLPQAILATIVTVLVVTSLASATSIGTNISTDGSLSVVGTTTIGTNFVVIDTNNSKIGIGSSSPQSTLEVVGQIGLSQHPLRLKDTSATIQFERNGVVTNVLSLDTNPDTSSYIKASNFRVTQNFLVGGNVGIGTTTPQYDLDVNGNLRASSTAFQTFNFGMDAEASDTYVINPNPTISSYVPGLQVTFIANTANTGACTVNVNGLGAKALKMQHDQDPYDNFIESGSVVMAIYDGTNFQMIHPSANPIGASNAALTWGVASMADDSAVPSVAGKVLYRATLTAGSASDVKLSSIRIQATSTGISPFADSNISTLELYLDGNLLQSQSNAITEGTGGTSGYVDFDSLNTSFNTISKSSAVTLELRADFASSFSSNGLIELGIGDAVSKDPENNNINESFSSAAITPTRSITVVDKGTLAIELKTDDAKADTDTFILAGTSTTANRYLGEIELTAAHEDIQIDSLILGQFGDATNADIASVYLYDSSGGSIATSTPSADGHVAFDPLSITISEGSAVSYFVGVAAKGVNVNGDPQSTATHGRNIQFNFASSSQLTTLGYAANEAVVAQGVDSGNAITIVEDSNGSVVAGEYSGPDIISKVTTITGSVLLGIANSLNNGTLSAGSGEIIGTYTFTFDNGSNRFTDDSTMLAEINELILTVATSSCNVRSIIAYIDPDTATTTTPVEVDGSGLATIDLTTLASNAELVDGAIDLVIKGDVSNVSGPATLNTQISNLATDFTFNGNKGSGTNFSNARLDYTNVPGATFTD